MLVALTPGDSRFASEKIARAPAIFEHNDVKYEVNKKRAQFYASRENHPITYSCAKDTASAEALQEKQNLSQEKLQWLQRHDRESGDLYGMLPLVRGMPVALTDHVDRSH